MGRINHEKFKVLNGVFDEFTLETLEILRRKHYYDSLGKPIKTGKEGDVYQAFKDGELKAIKLYRVTSANFKNISTYIQRDFRFRTIKGNLRKVILVWVEKEFRNLQIAHKANVSVPYPYKQKNNVILMDYIAGPMLKDIELENPKDFFKKLLEEIYLLKNSAKLIHGDLSEFNILVLDENPILIDFGQAMSIKHDEDFKNNYDLYLRDIKNIVRYFNKKYKFEISLKETLDYLKK